MLETTQWVVKNYFAVKSERVGLRKFTRIDGACVSHVTLKVSATEKKMEEVIRGTV